MFHAPLKTPTDRKVGRAVPCAPPTCPGAHGATRLPVSSDRLAFPWVGPRCRAASDDQQVVPTIQSRQPLFPSSRAIASACLLAAALWLAGCSKPSPASHPAGRAPRLPAVIFYVATNGNDSWSGASPDRNSASTDGPFATLDRALEATRAARTSATALSSFRPAIYLRGGSYFLPQTLVLKPEDSGLLLAAYRGEAAVLSGGKRITGWRETTLQGKKVWCVDLVNQGDKDWDFRELWVNGRTATRARHPNHGYLDIVDLPDKTPNWEMGHSRFRFKPGDLHDVAGADEAEIVAMTRWVESRLPIVHVDEAQRIVACAKRSVFELQPGDVYYAEGAITWLDAPGEWCLEHSTRRVYYLPHEGELLSAVEAIAPRLSEVVRIAGQPENGSFVEDITLRGLTYSHAEWNYPTGFHPTKKRLVDAGNTNTEPGGFAQAAYGVPGAVWGEGVRRSTISGCTFTRLGTYGLELGRGCQSNLVSRCEFSDLGAGGIKLGETYVRANEAERAGANEVSDCVLRNGGLMFPSAVGIWIGQSPGNRILHNLIYDFYYTGISIGWTWGYTKPSLAGDNLVTGNHVHHIGVKSSGDGPILSDMGGIYTLGRQPGTAIVNNLWHDIAGRAYGGWGIYFDEGSSGILAASNLVYRTTHGGFHEHYGETNRVFNNIFAFGRDAQIQFTRPETHLSFLFETNLVYFDTGTLLTGNWSGDQYVMDYNLYYDARGNVIRFGDSTLEQWRAKDHDRHSIIADPLFAAVRKDDYRLKSDSPALKLNFQPLDLRNAGPRPIPKSPKN